MAIKLKSIEEVLEATGQKYMVVAFFNISNQNKMDKLAKVLKKDYDGIISNRTQSVLEVKVNVESSEDLNTLYEDASVSTHGYIADGNKAVKEW